MESPDLTSITFKYGDADEYSGDAPTVEKVYRHHADVGRSLTIGNAGFTSSAKPAARRSRQHRVVNNASSSSRTSGIAEHVKVRRRAENFISGTAPNQFGAASTTVAAQPVGATQSVR